MLVANADEFLKPCPHQTGHAGELLCPVKIDTQVHLKGDIAMQNNPVVWFEIYITDMQRAKKFYENVLAIKLEKLDSPAPNMEEMLSFPSREKGFGATGALAKMTNGPVPGGGTIVYFACKDCKVETGRVVASGGKVKKDKFAIGQYGFIALVADTEGNTIGLHSME